MLALATTDALVLLDAQILKHAPSSAPSCQSLIDRPTSSTWSADNTCLFLASSSAIHKYDPLANSLQRIHSTNGSEQISQIVAKDKGNTLIFSVGQLTQVLEYSSGKISQTFDSHKSPITSIALSNDSSLLASTSTGAAHVYNLTLGSHTVLRGLPAVGVRINTCVFHTHTRTRILLGAGRQLLVYDTTRPSGPVKVIPMSDSSMGEIGCVACSPFSKTLVAFATTAGNVSLVDLDKEKACVASVLALLSRSQHLSSQSLSND
jgi:protein NEDD1